MTRTMAARHAARLFWGVMASGLLVVFGLALVWLLGTRHTPPMTVWQACLMMMRQVWSTPMQLAPNFPVAGGLVVLMLGSGAWAGWRGLAAWWHTHRLLTRSLSYRPATWPVLDTAVVTFPAMQPRLRILETKHPVACTVGVWQPQIVLSAGLITMLSSAEVRAVLGHEWSHARRRDPLRLLLLRFWSSTLWFLPIVRALARDSARSMEEAADDAAVRLTDQPLDLAAALVKTAKAQAQPRWSPLPALGEAHTVSVRVERLLEVTPTRHRQRHYRVWAASTVVAIFLLGSLLLPRHPGAAAVSVAPIPAQQPMMACPMPLAQG